MIRPPTTFAAEASGALSRIAPIGPSSASFIVHESVAFVSANVLVRGTAPGMFATQ